MSAQVAADLRAAAEVLRRDGWTQGVEHSEQGHCLIGALEVVVDPDSWQLAVGWDAEQNHRMGSCLTALRDVVNQGDLAFWNDIEDRLPSEVIAALEAAADAAEATP